MTLRLVGRFHRFCLGDSCCGDCCCCFCCCAGHPGFHHSRTVPILPCGSSDCRDDVLAWFYDLVVIVLKLVVLIIWVLTDGVLSTVLTSIHRRIITNGLVVGVLNTIEWRHRSRFALTGQPSLSQLKNQEFRRHESGGEAVLSPAPPISRIFNSVRCVRPWYVNKDSPRSDGVGCVMCFVVRWIRKKHNHHRIVVIGFRDMQ